MMTLSDTHTDGTGHQTDRDPDTDSKAESGHSKAESGHSKAKSGARREDRDGELERIHPRMSCGSIKLNHASQSKTSKPSS